MKLYQFDFGMFPRRVAIYLAEKGIVDIEVIDLDVMGGATQSPEHLARNPAGTVPVVETDSGEYICNSMAILEYIEEIYPTPNMIGNSPVERAKTRDMLSVINELFVYLTTYWAHKSPVMAQRFTQNPEVGEAAYIVYQQKLELLNGMIGEGPFLCGEQITIADCALFGPAQFSHILYKEPLPEACPKYAAWYEMFSKRASAVAPTYPPMLVELAPPAHD